MKKEISKFLSLNWFDIIKAIIMFFLTSLGDAAYQLLQAYQSNKDIPLDWVDIFRVAGISTAMYIIKQYFTGKPKDQSETK